MMAQVLAKTCSEKLRETKKERRIEMVEDELKIRIETNRAHEKQDEDKLTEIVEIEKGKTGLVIGKKGKRINEIKEKNKVSI